MASPSTAEVVVTSRPTEQEHHSYVDWPAIIAGIVLASAISLVMLTFGSAIGLSFANFRSFDGVNPIWVAIAAASWLLWVQISSFMAGGYVTGRMRRRFHDATEHEVDVRDGIHGLLVWGGALVVGALIAVSGLSAAVSTIGNVVGTATNAAANAADDANLDPNAYFTDALFRPAAAAAAPAATGDAAAQPATPAADATAQPAPAQPAATPATGGTSGGQSSATADTRAEAARILATSVTGPVSDADRAYLATLVQRDAALPAADAQARVDQVLGQMDQAKQTAADLAEKARKTGVLAAFLTAAALLASAIGAYWAASMGGRHRDEGTVLADFFRPY